MKIGIDARLYGPKQGGLGRYLQKLIEGLEKTDQNNDYVIFLRAENFEEYNPQNPRFKKVLADVSWYGWREQLTLPKILKKEKLDFIHFPHWNIPFFYFGKFIVTIHDLILYHYPTKKASTLGPFIYFLKNLAYKFILRCAIKKSKFILTPSNFTKQDIVKTFRIPETKITVTPLGLTCSGIKCANEEILINHGINKPYLLYVGVAYPHKNLEGLLSAWRIFEERNKNFNLVLVGKKNYFYERLLNSKDYKNCQNIIFTDFVSDENLSCLYKKATAYIFPSFYEGFGLPPLEAMQYNVPVISSDKTCLPEVLGDSVLYFNPENIQDIYTKINTILTQENIRQKLINNIPNILARYSQKNTSEITLSVYQKMV